MRALNWIIFVSLVPFIAVGVGLYCGWLALLQGIECAAEMLDE
jgi:hypothetical protein